MKLQLICLHPDTSLEYWLKLDGNVLCRPPRGQPFVLAYAIDVHKLGWRSAKRRARQQLEYAAWPTSADVLPPARS